MASIQQNRIVRFLMVLVAVVLTIFIYASYYSNPAMTMQTRIHPAAAIVSSSEENSQQQHNGQQKLANFSVLVVDKENSKQPQKNSESSANASYVPPSNEAQSHSSSHHKSPLTGNREIDEKSLPLKNANTSVSQPLVKKAGNGTTLSLVVPGLSSSLSSVSSSSSTSPSSSVISQPSSISSVASSQKPFVPPIQQHTDPLDPSKGIPTTRLYESGHLDTDPQLCVEEGEPLKLLIVITSAPLHQEARLAIRQTWGHYKARRDVAIAFILGRTGNQSVEDALSVENYMYGDLIRGHFVDSYNNLTLKTISVLEWVDKNCPRASYVLKTDDDMFINVPKLLTFIEKHRNDKRIIFGRLAKKWKPIRNKKSKYYVSLGQFSQTIFPHFTTGPAYLMSSDIIHDLYMKALDQTYLKLEDVFTTGIVAQLLSIKRIHVNEFLNRRIAFNPCNIRKAISVHMVKSNEQFDLWKKLLDTSTKCK